LVEQGTENPRVGSSILSLATIFILTFSHPDLLALRSPPLVEIELYSSMVHDFRNDKTHSQTATMR
jgi:hypothetical protein